MSGLKSSVLRLAGPAGAFFLITLDELGLKSPVLRSAGPAGTFVCQKSDFG